LEVIDDGEYEQASKDAVQRWKFKEQHFEIEDGRVIYEYRQGLIGNQATPAAKSRPVNPKRRNLPNRSE
jgi:hypothetical protein